MNNKLVTTIVVLAGTAIYNVAVNIYNNRVDDHNDKIMSKVRGGVMEIVSKSKDEAVQSEGKKLLKDELKSYYSQKEILIKYKSFLIEHAL